jgi:ribonucleoside-diphosphate reductase alpha chain
MLSSNAVDLMQKRYMYDGETPESALRRVAKALSIRDKAFEKELYDSMVEGVFFPNSPAIRNAGKKKGMLSACFVLPIEDSISSIFETAKNMAQIFQRGGGVGMNFAPLRPKNSPLSSGGTSSGAVSFMGVFDSIIHTVKQGGFRRGAALGALTYTHPEIFDFCRAKLTRTLTNFNLSILVTDDFMKKATGNGGTVDLVHDGEVYKTVRAKDILDLATLGAWVSGDPGLLFYDRINKDNKNPGVPITCTNPCLTGDTLIAVADGRNAISIKQLAEEGKDVPVYCMNKKGKISVRTMRNPRLTGFNEKVYRVTFDDGNYVKVTGNHKFVLSDGTFKQTLELITGDSISIMMKRMAPLEKILKHSNSKSSNYFWLKSSNSKSWNMEHRLICNFYHGPINWKTVVHHNDYNSMNNFPDNLVPMSKIKHDDLHRVDKLGDKNPMVRFPDKNIFNNPQFQEKARKYHLGRKRSSITCQRISDSWSIRRSDPTFKERHSEETKKGMRKNYDKFESYIYQRAIKKLEECQSKTDLKCFLNGNEVYVEKICEGCGTKFSVSWMKREQSYHDLYCWNNKQILGWKKVKDVAFNHKVVSVEFDGCEDVYNGTVDEFHNFYIGHFETTIDGDKSYCYINTLQCGEEPLPPWGACCLGSLNLVKFVDANNFQFDKFYDYVKMAGRALLNINTINWYPIPQIHKVMTELNPIGIGVMGFADAMIMLGIRYDSDDCLDFIDKLSKPYIQGSEEVAPDSFYKRAIVPTGSVSILADCSASIEPVFARNFERHVVAGVFKECRDIYSSELCRTAHEITPEWHLKVLAKFQSFIDAGVSKTVNVSNDIGADDIKQIYIQAWKMGCKGITVYRDGSIDNGVLISKEEKPKKGCEDPETCML